MITTTKTDATKPASYDQDGLDEQRQSPTRYSHGHATPLLLSVRWGQLTDDSARHDL